MRQLLSLYIVAIALFGMAAPSLAQSQPAAPTTKDGPFEIRSITLPDGSQRKYALFVPPQYKKDGTHRWPMLVFLHGSGERGDNGISQTKVGLPVIIRGRPDRFPFITVIPQAKDMWFRGREAVAVWAEMEQVAQEYRIDSDRIILTGLSMGGFAAWDLSMARPDIFAAIVPVCGYGSPDFAANIKNLPVWAFHGTKDPNVPVEGSRRPIAELRRLGAKPKYTEYPDLLHNCWDQAYSTTDLYRWMLRQRRKSPPRVIEHVFSSPVTQIWWLAAEAAPNAKTYARIRAEIDKDNHIKIQSDNVIGWAIASNDEPLKPGTNITITWNGAPVYQGVFNGTLTLRPTTATQPTEAHPRVSKKP